MADIESCTQVGIMSGQLNKKTYFSIQKIPHSQHYGFRYKSLGLFGTLASINICLVEGYSLVENTKLFTQN